MIEENAIIIQKLKEIIEKFSTFKLELLKTFIAMEIERRDKK